MIEAKKKLSQIKGLKIVGITGSYGKTTTKEILEIILQSKFRTFATPENVNTDIGIANFVIKSINSSVDVLIVEMGAYKRGEIKKICELVQPDISVITGISEQHLALFGKLENILKTKYEIVEYAKDDVFVVINGDCDLCLRIAGKSGKKEILYSTKKELSLWASGIKPTKDHVVFNVCYKKETQRFDVQMFGEYNVSNVLAATAVALQLGLTLAEISRSLSQSSRTRKVGRIAIKRSRFGYRIIDDSYNSNSQGFLAALDFLGFIQADKHILVTIGILELGEKINEVYDKLSKKIVDVCDVLVTTDKKLVRKVKKRDTDFKVVFDTGIEKQLSFLRNEVSKRDVVLFEGPNQRIISEVVNSK